MYAIAIVSLLAAAGPLASAAKVANEARSAFYVCANNNFRGTCSVDPCALPWCPDYAPYTYDPAGTAPPVKHPEIPTPNPAHPGDVCPTGTGFFQVCANGFRGCCKSDACGPAGWCPDYYYGTYTPVTSWRREVRRSDPTVCAPGTGFFQSCSNGFRGCCKSDACGPAGWCPQYYPGTYTPVPTYKPRSVRRSDPTVCAPGTGFFQSCSNGFRGCCKTDACGPAGWCAAYKKGTYEPVGEQGHDHAGSWPEAPEVPAPNHADPSVCAPGTGFFQVCANGFRGCCKSDACSLGYCPQ